MSHQASWPLRIAYIVCLLGIVAPIGLSASSWVSLTLGRSMYLGNIPTLIVAVLILVLGVWRIWVVAADQSTLGSPRVEGALLLLRCAGVFFVYVGALTTFFNWFGGPLIRLLVKHRSEDGIEFYVAGVFLAILGGLGRLGLLMFELSRTRSFELQADRDAP
jgi:hypothetical protein